MKALAQCVIAVSLTVLGMCAVALAGEKPADWSLHTLSMGMSKDAIKKLGFTPVDADALLYIAQEVSFGGKKWTPYAQMDNGKLCSWSLVSDTDQPAVFSEAALAHLAKHNMVVFALAGPDSTYSLLDRAADGVDAAKIQREMARFIKKHFISGQPNAMYLIAQQTVTANWGKRGQEAFVAFAPKETVYAVQTDVAGVQITASPADVTFDPDVE